MEVIVDEGVVSVATTPSKPSSRQTLVSALLFVATLVMVAVGLRTHVTGGLNPVDAVAFGLTVVWAVVGLFAIRFADRANAGVDPYALLIAADALLAAVAL